MFPSFQKPATLPTTAGVLQKFQQTMSELDNVAAVHAAEAQKKRQEAAQAAAAAEASETEANLAREAFRNFAKLVGFGADKVVG
jgi:hypothetical protein